MKKKILSVILAGAMVASVGAVTASALYDEKTHLYTPGEGIETYRYYFAMPKNWYQDETNKDYATGQAGVYWWSGTDKCKSLADASGTLDWPAYTMHKDETLVSDYYDMFYVDCPQDVPAIIFNNYVNGGTDKTAPIFAAARQTNDVYLEPLMYDDATPEDIFSTSVFDYMIEAFESGDEAALGEFKSNFFFDEDWESYSLSLDNMVFIAPQTPTDVNEQSGQPTYKGEWYFYYGDGICGNYPTLEATEAAADGKVVKLASEPATPDVPTTLPTDPTIPEPQTDPTSSTDPAATPDQEDSTPIQTGSAAHAVALFAALATACGAVAISRKKFEK